MTAVIAGSADSTFSNGININSGKFTVDAATGAVTSAAGMTLAGAVSGITTLSITTGTGNIGWGVYTPTLANVSNIAASTVYEAQYLRVGNSVTVSGRLDIDPTSTGATEFTLTLPIASTFGVVGQCAGTASATTVVETFAVTINTVGGNKADFQGVAVETGNHQMAYSFTYKIV